MMKNHSFIKKNTWMTPGRFIVLGFASVILVGAFFLCLPIAHNPGVQVPVLDALFTSTSAVCVTGLITLDPGDTFSVFGRTVIGLLIQIGGLGITSIGVFFITLSGKKINMRNRTLVKEALNYSSYKGVIGLVRSVIIVTLFFEIIGAVLSYIVFVQDYSSLDALGYSLFHAVAAFNNAGFDVFGGFQSLARYEGNVLLNVVTMALIIAGGIGFFVICEVFKKRKFKKFSLHTKVVISVTAVLLLAGAVFIKATTEISWLGAFFTSTSARTAGFASFSMGEFTNAALLVVIILMFIGASPGSTGGGIKTTSFFVMIRSVFSYAANKECIAFRRKIPQDIIRKSFVIGFLGVSVVCGSTLLVSFFEPTLDFMKILFEVVSAFSTSGLSTGITPGLSEASKVVLICTMFIGRLGPFVMASIWFKHSPSHVSYVEENITIG